MAVRLRKLPPTIFQRFFRTETASGSVLLLFGIAALALANSPLAAPYAGIWRIPLNVGIADYSLSLTVHQWDQRRTDGCVFPVGWLGDQTGAGRR